MNNLSYYTPPMQETLSMPTSHAFLLEHIPPTHYDRVPKLETDTSTHEELLHILQAGGDINEDRYVKDILQRTLRYTESSFGYEYGFPLQTRLLRDIDKRTR